jgi:hypothetical protein
MPSGGPDLQHPASARRPDRWATRDNTPLGITREAAVDAINDGTEAVTRDHLDDVLLDYAAEENAAQARQRAAATARATKKKPSTNRATPKTTAPLAERPAE